MVDRKTLEFLKNKKRLSYTDLLKTSVADYFEKLSRTIDSHNARQILFHAETGILDIPVCKCGKLLQWNDDTRSYRKFCSRSCTATYTLSSKKENNLRAYGKEWHSQTAAWAEKVKATNTAKFGADYYAKTDQFKAAVRQTVRRTYQVDHVMQLDSVKEKVSHTNLVRYNESNPAKSQAIKAKIKNTNLHKYGAPCVLSNSGVRDQIKQTNLARYGAENAGSNCRVITKRVSTRQLNYYTENQLLKLSNSAWLRSEHESGKPVWVIARDLGVSASNLCKIFHKHGIEIKYFSKSEIERQLVNYYQSFGLCVIENSRDIIPPKELDLYFPDFRVAVEVNGVYFHSEKFGKNSNYHLDKTVKCREQGINLLQFWDYEFNQAWDKVIDTINRHLKLTTEIHADSTQLVILSSQEKSEFINQTHLKNDDLSDINLGLVDHANTLVAVATFRISVADESTSYELLQLCFAHNISVLNGASTLVKAFVDTYMKTGEVLVASSDCRYSNDSDYESCGFVKTSICPPDYFYITGSGKCSSPADDSSKYYRVWDCGQTIFTLTKK